MFAVLGSFWDFLQNEPSVHQGCQGLEGQGCFLNSVPGCMRADASDEQSRIPSLSRPAH
jgi:hypothetical protein